MGALLLLTVVEGSVAVWGSARAQADITEVTQRSGELQRTLSIYTSLFKIESSVKSMLWAKLDNDEALYAAEKKTSLSEFTAASQAVDALTTGLSNHNSQDQAVALRWTALQPGAVDVGLIDMDAATTIEEALDVVSRFGGPPLSVIVTDERGRIGRTVCGRIPVGGAAGWACRGADAGAKPTKEARYLSAA